MKRLAGIVALLLLLIAAAPVSACLTDAAMSHAEAACCVAMHGNCGAMAQTGCCRTEVRTDQHPQLASIAPSSEQFVLIDRLLPFVFALQAPPSFILQIPADHSPPGLLLVRTTVLRV